MACSTGGTQGVEMTRLFGKVLRVLIVAGLGFTVGVPGSAYTIENQNLAFTVGTNGSWTVLDKTTGEAWSSNSSTSRFAYVSASNGSSSSNYSVTSFAEVCSYSSSMVLRWSPDQKIGSIRFVIELLPDGKSVRVSWSQSGGTWKVTSVRFPDNSFRSTATQNGYLVVPSRMGIMVPAGQNAAGTVSYPTYRSYGGCSMAMAGAVKNGSATLISWADPYCTLETYRSSDLSYVYMSVVSSGPSGFVQIRPVGSGGYLEIARAYRDVARDRGLLVTWADKFPSGGNPLAGREYLSSMCVYNNASGPKTVEATFAQCAGIAEHHRNDLGIDKAMYNLWGWQFMGYDRHPDDLPAAPECGGNAGLIDCSNRVKACGYLFGLRDNYQDIYEDSPSWNVDLIRKKADGSMYTDGVWAGALAYNMNSQKGFEIARRANNIPGIKSLFNPTSYYIDTTFASPLIEDFSSLHPQTLNDDMYWKRRLCQYARQTFGVFGSEEGVEWGVPCADFFESLMTATKNIFPTFNEVPVPLFEMVYGDCVQIYQGDRTTVQTPNSVLDHILCAEMPVQWTDVYNPAKPWCRISSAHRTNATTIQVTYTWKTYGQAPQGNYGFIAQYADPASTDCWAAVAADAHAFSTPTNQWPASGTYVDGPITLSGSAFTTPASGETYLDVYVFMTTNPDGTGSRVRVRGFDICLNNGYINGYGRYYIDRLTLKSDGTIAVSYPVLPDLYNFGRCDTKRDSSYQNEGLTLNTYKICGPLNSITSNSPMTYHTFLTSDRTVQRSRFGDDVEITVNYGSTPYSWGSTVLPQYGFLIESPTHVAFRASAYGGRTFSQSTLAVVTSTNGMPIATSTAVSTYRAYGDTAVTVAGRTFILN